MKSGLKFNPGLAPISLQTTGIRSATLNGWQGAIQDWTTHNPRPLYHLRHHQISYHKCVHAAIVPLFARVPERGRSMELHITFQSCQSIWLIITRIVYSIKMNGFVMSKLIIFIFSINATYIFLALIGAEMIVQKERRDAYSRSDRILGWRGTGGGSKKFYMGRLGQRSNSLIPYPLYLPNFILCSCLHICEKWYCSWWIWFKLSSLGPGSKWGKKTKKKISEQSKLSGSQEKGKGNRGSTALSPSPVHCSACLAHRFFFCFIQFFTFFPTAEPFPMLNIV